MKIVSWHLVVEDENGKESILDVPTWVAENVDEYITEIEEESEHE